jgi:phosphonate transport system permease protein
VLGIVGAGGIGQSLYENIRSFRYANTAAIILIVIATVVTVDLMSWALRRMLV